MRIAWNVTRETGCKRPTFCIVSRRIDSSTLECSRRMIPASLIIEYCRSSGPLFLCCQRSTSTYYWGVYPVPGWLLLNSQLASSFELSLLRAISRCFSSFCTEDSKLLRDFFFQIFQIREILSLEYKLNPWRDKKNSKKSVMSKIVRNEI